MAIGWRFASRMVLTLNIGMLQVGNGMHGRRIICLGKAASMAKTTHTRPASKSTETNKADPLRTIVHWEPFDFHLPQS